MSEKHSDLSSLHISPLTINDARTRLFAHKSLFDLWKASWLLGFDWLQIVISVLVFLGVLGLTFFGGVAAKDAIGNARLISSDGLNFATTLLGFLIAGFTVFATITKPEIFALMARWPEENGLTHLQKIFLLFMQVFAHYCAFCLVCVLLKLLGAPGGVLPVVFSGINQELKLIFCGFVWAALSGWLVYLLLILPIFIFNIYSMQLVVIDVAMQEQELGSGNTN